MGKLYYALPNKLFEYMLAGIPVVASDFPELRRIVREYHVGCVVDPHDTREIADAITSLVSDEKRFRKMKENAAPSACSNFWGFKTRPATLLNHCPAECVGDSRWREH